MQVRTTFRTLTLLSMLAPLAALGLVGCDEALSGDLPGDEATAGETEQPADDEHLDDEGFEEEPALEEADEADLSGYDEPVWDEAEGEDGEIASVPMGITGSTVATVCRRWNADRVDRSEGTWSGSAMTCSPGDISSTGRSNALKLVNLYRYLANLPAVTLDAAKNKDAQACALTMQAANKISHYPTSSWPCYTTAAATAAAKSNIATTGAVRAVDLYMLDFGSGNAAALGHRRYLLSNRLGPIGVGSTGKYSCMWVLGGVTSATRPWTAWPAAGVFPIQAMNAGTTYSLDKTGWSIQSDTIDFTNATVKVTSGGVNMPVIKRKLSNNYGSKYGMAFTPSGWVATAGKTYRVTVSGVSAPFSYDVQMTNCTGY